MVRYLRFALLFSVLLFALIATAPQAVRSGPMAVTYYVSNEGDDANDGLSPEDAFATIAKVNSLNLAPGDHLLFQCGDVWRAEMLVISQSGAQGNPITFGAFPADCENQPLLSGAQPISGWTLYQGDVYVADLSAGENAGKFAFGVNQLFRDEQRLRLGRWPNLDDPASDNGYASIDAQPAGNHIRDDMLPAGDWTGAAAHVRGMRWYILNRAVQGNDGATLNLNASLDCYTGSCAGWGYFLNNHFSTLDQDGEWYYDAAASHIYLYSAGGAPANVEGSVVLKDDDRSWGGVVLGKDLGDHISDVVIENLAVSRWFRHGIATPTNLHEYENSRVVIRNNTIKDVDAKGINLTTWVYDALDGSDSWRGGSQMTISGNLIDGPNHKGIDSYARHSTIEHNVIRNVALTENLGQSGMGCKLEDGGGHCTEDGDGIRIKVDEVADSGNNNLVQYNRLEKIGYNGMDVFGPHNTIAYNFIQQACYSKGDCGGVRTYGSANMNDTHVHDLLFDHNIIVDTIGNTDGCIEQYKALFGLGLYFDHYSRDVESRNNTIINSTLTGILYQQSTGWVRDNVLYDNSSGTTHSAQVYVGDTPALVYEHSGNVLYGLGDMARTLSSARQGGLASDDNYFFHPFVERHISVDGVKTLAEWQAYSGQDTHSLECWFSLNPGDEPLSQIFYNDTTEVKTIGLGPKRYLDLDQNPVLGSITLQPFTSQILIYDGEISEPDLSPSRKMASPVNVVSGQRITYTIVAQNLYGAMPNTINVVDNVPVGLTYISDTLTANTGVVDDAGAPTLRWSGVLSPTPTALISYAVSVDYVYSGTATLVLPRVFENVAEIGALGYTPITRSATVCADCELLYLPVVFRQG